MESYCTLGFLNLTLIMIRQTWLSWRTLAHKNPPLEGGGGGGGNGCGRKIGKGSGGLTMSLSQYNRRVYRKVVRGGGWGNRGVGGGGVNKQRLRSGFIGGGFSGLILCCFYSKQRDQNTEVDCWGMHSGWWVCIGSGDSVQLQLLRFENNI